MGIADDRSQRGRPVVIGRQENTVAVLAGSTESSHGIDGVFLPRTVGYEFTNLGLTRHTRAVNPHCCHVVADVAADVGADVGVARSGMVGVGFVGVRILQTCLAPCVEVAQVGGHRRADVHITPLHAAGQSEVDKVDTHLFGIGSIVELVAILDISTIVVGAYGQ